MLEHGCVATQFRGDRNIVADLSHELLAIARRPMAVRVELNVHEVARQCAHTLWRHDVQEFPSQNFLEIHAECGRNARNECVLCVGAQFPDLRGRLQLRSGPRSLGSCRYRQWLRVLAAGRNVATARPSLPEHVRQHRIEHRKPVHGVVRREVERRRCIELTQHGQGTALEVHRSVVERDGDAAGRKCSVVQPAGCLPQRQNLIAAAPQHAQPLAQLVLGDVERRIPLVLVGH